MHSTHQHFHLPFQKRDNTAPNVYKEYHITFRVTEELDERQFSKNLVMGFICDGTSSI